MRLFRKTIVAAALLAAFSSCQKMSEQDLSESTKTLSFNVGFDVSQDVLGRGAETGPIASLVVYDYVNGELKNEITQSVDDVGFGTVEIDATYGEHQLIFVGHNSTSCSYDNDNSLLTFTDKVLDTFTHYQTLTVGSETSSSQSVTLDRQVAGIKITALDAIPSNAASITLVVDGYSFKLNPKTGTGSNGEKLTRRWEYTTKNVGAKNTSYMVFSFLPSDNHTVDVTITVTDTDDKVYASYTVNDVPVEKNRETVISGNIFTSGIAVTANVNTDWGENIEVSL